MIRYEAVIFDIDNVLADTRRSYTDCIRETVQVYLVKRLRYRASSGPLLSRKDVETFKLLGGFNDDWDACYGLLLYLGSLKLKHQSITGLKKLKNLPGLANRLTRPLSVRKIERAFGKNPRIKLRSIGRIFQKLYWSKYIKRESPAIPNTLVQKLFNHGVQIGIATGRTRKEALFVLRRFGLLQFIKKIVSTSDLPSRTFKKPHPYSLLTISRAF